MLLAELNIEFAIVEVSGPPCNPDHAHYVGDRNKIAKNLKSILNFIRIKHSGDFEDFRKIKVVGVQIYENYCQSSSRSCGRYAISFFQVQKASPVTYQVLRNHPETTRSLIQ